MYSPMVIYLKIDTACCEKQHELSNYTDFLLAAAVRRTFITEEASE